MFWNTNMCFSEPSVIENLTIRSVSDFLCFFYGEKETKKLSKSGQNPVGKLFILTWKWNEKVDNYSGP